MPLTLDATVGGEEANSYVTLAEAEVYFASRVDAEWPADADAQARALLTAAVQLERVTFRGYLTSTAQALSWPRSGLRDRGGRHIPSDAIPAAVKRAQMEEALALAAGGALDDLGLDAFETAQVGPLSVKLRSGVSSAGLSTLARRELAPFVLGGGHTIRLVQG
jgi:hypothetical protein